MGKLMILGKNLKVTQQRSNTDSVLVTDHEIVIRRHSRPTDDLLKEFLADLLHAHLLTIYDQIRAVGDVEIFGPLDFDVVQRIDNRKWRVAKLRGSTILVKLNAVALPRGALEYVIAHEIAHTVTKGHTERFWKTVELMCPNLEEGRELLMQYGSYLSGELLLSA